MTIFDLFSLLGGLALFLFGMQVLGDALSKVSGGRMEKILEKMTSNPIKGVLLGALVTGVIQSSSATTVMVVGFVNAGIMKLSQTVGIIMGANIGTTITSWLLSLVGIESDNLIMQLFKPTSFSPLLAFVGILLLMIFKKERIKDVGTILLGFAVLMFGMDAMSGAVEPLADVPEFRNLMVMFSNPILGLGAGIVLTAIIQSSSASVGILQALCVTGTIPFSVVFPIIMGQNIGTCVTALLSGIGASKNARRAALIHLYFNVIGTIIFLILFYTLNAFIQFSFFHDAATPMGIAIVHSVFNVTATIILLPFGKLLEKLACFTIKDDPKKEEVEKVDRFSILDERFLETPGLAMEQCQNAALDMANLAKDAFLAAHALFSSYSDEKLNAVKEQEDLLDRYEDELGSYLVKLSSKNMSVKDSHMLTVLLHCIGDLERIGDHAVNVAHSAKEMNEKNLRFSDAAEEELKVYAQAIKDILVTAVSALETQDVKVAQSVEPLEEVIDDLSDELMSRHVRRLRKGECTIEMGFILADIMNNYERVSDHCSNIAICAIQESEDVEAHQYMEKMRSSENHDFVSAVEVFKKKYLLP